MDSLQSLMKRRSQLTKQPTGWQWCRNFLWNSQTPKVLFPPVFNQLHMVHMSKTKNHYGSFQTDHHTKSYKLICKDKFYIHHFNQKINLNAHVYQPKPHGNHNFPSDMVLSFPRWTRGWRNQSRNSGVAWQGYKGSCQHSLDHHPWWWWQEAPAVALTHDSEGLTLKLLRSMSKSQINSLDFER